MLEILLAISFIIKQLEALTGMAATIQRENREPTEEEMQLARAARKAANDAAEAAGI